MPSIKEMNETDNDTTEVTQEQRKAALNTVQVVLRNSAVVDVYTEVAAYQMLDAILVIAQQDGKTTLIPMDTTVNVTIRQNKE